MVKISEYQSPNSVGKRQTIPIDVNDPRLRWDKIGQTKARSGSEIDQVNFVASSLNAIKAGVYEINSGTQTQVSNLNSQVDDVGTSVEAALAQAAIAYADASTALQPSAYAIQHPTTKQLTAIDATGLTVYSGASSIDGQRVVLNSEGIAGFLSDNTASFAINNTSNTKYYQQDIATAPGSAFFKGDIYGSKIFGGTLNINGNTIIESDGTLKGIGVQLTGTLFGGGKENIDSANSGYYLGSNGHFNLGDTSAYVRYDGSGTISLITSQSRTPDVNSDYNGKSKIILGSGGTQIYALPIQGDTFVASNGLTISILDYTYPHYGNSTSLGLYPRQRMLVEDPITAQVKVGMAVYYSTTSETPSGPASGGSVGDLWVVY